MNLEQKKAFVSDIKERFDAAPLVILTDFKGTTVDQFNSARRAFEAKGLHFQVVKNTLCRRALEGSDKAELAESFSGNVALLFSGEDPVEAAKEFQAQVKANDKLEIKAGYFEGDLLDGKGVEMVSKLPSREEMLVTVLRTMQEPGRQTLGVLQAPARDLLYLLNNFANKLEGEG